MLDVDELRRHVVKCELLTARSATVRTDELAEQRGSDEDFIYLNGEQSLAQQPP